MSEILKYLKHKFLRNVCHKMVSMYKKIEENAIIIIIDEFFNTVNTYLYNFNTILILV